MKKVIKQYEKKNKIIQEIEKNLRMICPNRMKQPQKRSRPATQLFEVDLPSLNLNRSYSPKSHHNFLRKKSLDQSSSQQNTNSSPSHAYANNPFLKTLCLIQQNKNHQPILLLNHNTTLKSFMKSIQKKNHSSLEKQFVPNNEMFVSPLKIKVASKQNKMNFRLTSDSEELDEKEEIFSKNGKRSTQYEKMMLQQIYSTQLARKQGKKQIDQNSYQLPFVTTMKSTITPGLDLHQRYKNKREKTNRSRRRSCSPWNYKQEGQQLLEIWDTGI